MRATIEVGVLDLFLVVIRPWIALLVVKLSLFLELCLLVVLVVIAHLNNKSNKYQN
jgi:hypothetical protein